MPAPQYDHLWAPSPHAHPCLHHHPQSSQLGSSQQSPAIPSSALAAHQGSTVTSFPPSPPVLSRCCCRLGTPHPCSVSPAVGFPAMPPLWALGFHLCRWGYGSSNETWQTVRAMRNYQIPQVTPQSRGGGVRTLSPIPEPLSCRMRSGMTSITWTGTGTSPSIPRTLPLSRHWWKTSTNTGSTTL